MRTFNVIEDTRLTTARAVLVADASISRFYYENGLSGGFVDFRNFFRQENHVAHPESGAFKYGIHIWELHHRYN